MNRSVSRRPSPRWRWPGAVLTAAAVASAVSPPTADPDSGAPDHVVAGVAAGLGGAAMDSDRLSTRSSRTDLLRDLRLRRPAPESPSDALPEITVTKFADRYGGIDFSESRRAWRYLTRDVRGEIDAASDDGGGNWRYAVIHSSATKQGNASALDYYHRHVKGIPGGMAYHFVIGNGSYTADGEIEVGQRWTQQTAAGGRAGSLALRSPGESISICLVGDFNRDPVSKAQLLALDELIDYLEARVGEIEIAPHHQCDPAAETCPGRNFPEQLLPKGNL